MKKIISTLLVSTFLSTGPAMASDTEAQFPQNSNDSGITAPDLNESQEGIVDPSADSEMDAQQWGRYRRCGWGSYLQAYRIRIGRFWVIRYRCVRYGRPGYPRYPRRPYPPPQRRWSEDLSNTQDQSEVQEPMDVQENSATH